jgi:hypothetical protein
MQLVDCAFLVELLDKPIVHQLVDVDIEDARIMKRHDLSHVRQVETRSVAAHQCILRVLRRQAAADPNQTPRDLRWLSEALARRRSSAVASIGMVVALVSIPGIDRQGPLPKGNRTTLRNSDDCAHQAW